MSRLLRRAGLNRLRSLDPPLPVVRYEHKLPGDLIHFDIKRLARIRKPGHRVTGNRCKESRGVGWEYLHVAIDDHSRIAFSAILPDQSHHSAMRFFLMARPHYARFPPNFIGGTAEPGFVQGTSYISSLNRGLNSSSTLSNPFPQGILMAAGNTNGGLTDVGQNVPTMYEYKQKSFYVEQWSFGLQYSPTSKDVFEATYEGNHAVHVPVGNDLNRNELPPQYLTMGSGALTALVSNPFYGQSAMAGSSCGLASQNVPTFQLMLPLPRFAKRCASSYRRRSQNFLR